MFIAKPQEAPVGDIHLSAVQRFQGLHWEPMQSPACSATCAAKQQQHVQSLTSCFFHLTEFLAAGDQQSWHACNHKSHIPCLYWYQYIKLCQNLSYGMPCHAMPCHTMPGQVGMAQLTSPHKALTNPVLYAGCVVCSGWGTSRTTTGGP